MALSDFDVAWATFVLLGGGVFVLLACSAFLGRAAARVDAERGGTRASRLPWILIGVIGAWFGFAVMIATAGPLDFAVVIPSAIIPIVAGTAITFLPKVAALLKAVPVQWLIYVQFYRVLGFLFIVPYFSSGLLTQGFALNAGIGDILTGLFAIPVAWLVARGGRAPLRPYVTWLFVAWTAFGILDLIVAPSSAAIFGFETLGNDGAVGFPITLIPMFFGPPFGILIHLVTLRAFWLQHRGADSVRGGDSALLEDSAPLADSARGTDRTRTLA